jgi:hypothetical protein
VGIGTTNPQDILHLYTDSPENRLTIESSDPASYAGVRAKTPNREYFYGINTNTDRWVVFDNNANKERLTITSNGDVGIGTIIPAYKLDVEGDVQAYAYHTGDLFFQYQGEDQWRMYEDQYGLYVENLETGKVYSFMLEEI